MKIQLSPHRGHQGAALLVALFLTTIIGVTIAGYLKHAQQQNYLSVRSQSWNLALAITEAGLEEARQHLRKNPNNLATDGWIGADTTFKVERNLTSSARYQVQISLAGGGEPQVICEAFVSPTTAPKTVPEFLFAALGVTTISQAASRTGNTEEIARAVQWVKLPGSVIPPDGPVATRPSWGTAGR